MGFVRVRLCGVKASGSFRQGPVPWNFRIKGVSSFNGPLPRWSPHDAEASGLWGTTGIPDDDALVGFRVFCSGSGPFT
jgi:hypothetical protein